MGKHRPHILVTTPESLYILLTAERSRAMLRTTRTVIVDEIHAVADDKRGSHLALSLARLDALTAEVGNRPQRIGLSATVKPIEEVAQFLSAARAHRQHRPSPRNGIVGRSSARRTGPGGVERNVGRDLRSSGPVNSHPSHHAGLRQHAPSCPSAWRMLWPSGWVKTSYLPHHGSLSRTLRLNAEARLKNGELRAVVATASLELGIDIGTVDLVCQIGSPRSIAVALQRVGRSGHWVGAKPKGRFFATTRDELIECAALVRAIRIGFARQARNPAPRRSTFSPSRLSPKPPRATGRKTICMNSCAVRILTAI